VWAILDDDAAALRLKQPVVAELRRSMDGWRKTDLLADRIWVDLVDCDPADDPRLRVHTARLIAAAVPGEAPPGAAFDQDWAAMLLHDALDALRRTRPRPHSLLLRTYDRPEGSPPFTPSQLAGRLEQPESEVSKDLAEARAELKRIFETEVAATLADDSMLAEEIALLEPYAARAFE